MDITKKKIILTNRSVGKNLLRSGNGEGIDHWISVNAHLTAKNTGGFTLTADSAYGLGVYQFVNVAPNTNYYFSYTASPLFASVIFGGEAVLLGYDGTFNSGNNSVIQICLRAESAGSYDVSEVQLELGSTATAYEAYKGFPSSM